MIFFNFRKKRDPKYQSIEGLSERASRYISTLPFPRSMDWTCDRETIVEYFESQEFPLFEKFIDFQLKYSGYTLTIEREEKKNDGRHQFDLLLFSQKEIEQRKKIDYFRVGDDYWISCGQHGCAPFHFCINQKGEIATTLNDEIVQVISSSAEKFIERYAIDNEMGYELVSFFKCVETAKIEEFMNEYYPILKIIEECSDKRCSYYGNEGIVIEHGTDWDSGERYLHLYGQKKKDCDIWVEMIKPLLR